ncbi:MAG: ABC transporter ATP-binding protein [bacterium]|nr:ABC transporter ATP-binding protein [bacterium]
MNKKVLRIIFKTVALAWEVDKRFVAVTTTLMIIGGLIPIATSYLFKITLDQIISIADVRGVITVALLGFLALRYLLEALSAFQSAFLYQYTQRLTRFKIQNYLNLELSRKISSLDVDHFQNADTQDLIEKVRQESTWRIPNYTNNIFFIINYGATLVGSFLALIPFGIWIPFLAIAVSYPRYRVRRLTNKLAWSLFNERTPLSRRLSRDSSMLQQELYVTEIRIAGNRDAFLGRITKFQDEMFKSVGKPLDKFLQTIWMPILLEAVFIFIMIYIKLPLVIAGALSIGSLTFLMQMFDSILSNTRNVNDQVASLLDDSLYADNYFKLMALPSLIVDGAHEFGDIKPPKIEFKNVNFSYPKGAPVIKNISFSVLPGEHLAIVGPNGAGKSTLIKLLLRFYDPAKGEIMVNNIDLRDIKRDNWYKFVGTLFQNFGRYSHLIVKENIAFSELESPDEERARMAAKLSGADKFIETFPKKYDEQLGREFDGKELSVGQWQKIALARAFYEEAPVLILDEPTSAIDAEAEAEIFDNLNKVYKDKTVIFISHRFSTVRHADKIIVLESGRITEEGTHQSLMKHDGTYARMFKKQAKGYIE